MFMGHQSENKAALKSAGTRKLQKRTQRYSGETPPELIADRIVTRNQAFIGRAQTVGAGHEELQNKPKVF
jgi:hypothetical protein